MVPRVSKLWKVLVSQDIGQHNALEIFTVKRSIISEISKELLNYIFAEFDKSSSIKNVTDRLNLDELQVDGISAKFTAERTKKYRCFFNIFSENWERRYRNFRPSIALVFYWVFCGNSVLLNREGWYLP